jgi:hypothetical protein
VAIIRKQDSPKLADQAIRRVLYVGHDANEICHFVTQHVGSIDILYESNVSAAIQLLRSRPFDIVMVDLRQGSQSLQLLLPLVGDVSEQTKLVVISPFQNVGHYLAVPGVARVLAAPVREGQFLRVLGLTAKLRHYAEPHVQADPSTAKAAKSSMRSSETAVRSGLGFVPLLLNKVMVVISVIYKRSATVLLLTLFAAFLFYGFLIAFFLLSSGWGAPMTLTRGHELVNKAERELTELRVALSLADQKITEAQFARTKAERELSDGEVMVKYAGDTAQKEISKITRLKKVSAAKIARLQRVHSALKRQLSKGGMSADLEQLYNKRLIDKRSYSSATLGVLEAGQRLSTVESELESMISEREDFEVSLELLESLKDGLHSGDPLSTVTAGSTELILLTKQAIDAKGMYDTAYERLSSTEELIAELSQSRQVLKHQINAIEASALARAVDKRIDVIFVPYSNRNSYQPGTRLYSCVFTVFFCTEAGSVGVPLPGEVSSVHPFFGKPIRGYFVEAKLRLDGAASREIIHGGRKPFFF